MKSMRPSVLIVEDDKSQQVTLEAMFENEFDLTIVSTLKEAVKVLASKSFSVALLDQNLPNGTGTSLISVLQAKHPATSIILFTGAVDNAQVTSAKTNKNVFRIVLKPYDPEILVSWINSAAKLSAMRSKK